MSYLQASPGSGATFSPFTNITGGPTQVAYFDALGNGISDSYFTRDENTKEGTMGFDVPAFGQVNNGSSQQVQWKADNAGVIGNSIALVFDGIDDTDTVLAAWNSANPTNTASVVGGTGNFVPPAGTAQFAGGGISGYTNTLDLGGQGLAGSGSLFTNGATDFSFNGLIGAGDGVAPFMLASDFATGEIALLEMGKTGLSVSVDTPAGDNSELNVQDNQARLRFNSVVNGQSGTNARDGSLQLINQDTVWEWATADGTSGQYLTTDGAGNLSFTSVVVPPPPAPTLADKTIGVGDSSNELTGYNTFVYDRTKSLFTQYIPNQVNGGVALGAPLTFGGATFTGSGLNDMTVNWSVSNYQSKKYGGILTVTIDGTGTPDTFDWRYSGAYSETIGAGTGVAITGAAQSLTDIYGNVIAEITFGATTGHTYGDYWKPVTSLSDPDWGMMLRDTDDHQIVNIKPATGVYIIGDDIVPSNLSGNGTRVEIRDATANAYLNAKNGAYLGDGLEDNNKSYFAVFDTLGFGKGKLNDFEIWDISNLNSYLRVSTTSQSTSIGKDGGAVLNVEEATSSVVGWINKFQLNNSTENKYFRAQYNSGNPLIEMGDLDAVGNSSLVTLDDANVTFTVSAQKIKTPLLPAYDDDAAAGSAGLTVGTLYQTTGSGSAPLNVAGIVMIKQ